MLRLLAVSVLALAATSLSAQAQVEDPYAECAAMVDDAQRLSCYDATHAERVVVLADAERRRIEEARLAEQRRIEEARLAEQRAAEEARLAEERRIAEYGMPGNDDEDDVEIRAEVSDFFTDRSGRALITLDNGQMWREVGGSSMRYPPSSGIATVEPHWSGAFTMRFEGRRGFLRVERYR